MIRAAFDLKSIAALQAALDGVKQGVQNKVLKQALGKAARAVAKDAKAQAPKGSTGLLARSMGSRYKSYRSSGVFVFAIGPRKGMTGTRPDGAKHAPTRIAHIVERGRKALTAPPGKVLRFWTLKGSGSRKRKVGNVVFRRTVRAAPGQPFMAPAYRLLLTKKTSIERDILAGITREAAKYASRGKSIYG